MTNPLEWVFNSSSSLVLHDQGRGSESKQKKFFPPFFEKKVCNLTEGRQGMTASACSSRSLSNLKIAFQGQVPIQSQRNRRKYQREPASFLVNCHQADLTRVGGKALNWSPVGIAIKTNCPICVGEQLTVEFVEPKTLSVHKVKGQVVWRQFHGDSSVQAEALFTAGIKFLNLNDSS